MKLNIDCVKKKVKNAIVNIELSSYWFVNMTGYSDQKSKHVRKFSLKVWRNWKPNLLFKKSECSPLSIRKLKFRIEVNLIRKETQRS